MCVPGKYTGVWSLYRSLNTGLGLNHHPTPHHAAIPSTSARRSRLRVKRRRNGGEEDMACILTRWEPRYKTGMSIVRLIASAGHKKRIPSEVCSTQINSFFCWRVDQIDFA